MIESSKSLFCIYDPPYGNVKVKKIRLDHDFTNMWCDMHCDLICDAMGCDTIYSVQSAFKVVWEMFIPQRIGSDMHSTEWTQQADVLTEDTT